MKTGIETRSNTTVQPGGTDMPSLPAHVIETSAREGPLTWPAEITRASNDIGNKSKNTNTLASSTLTIQLDDEERQLFDTLFQAAEALEKGEFVEVDSLHSSFSTQVDKPCCSPRKVQVRVAGGWVRDKILGLSTHDVDVALDTCSGVEFATVVQRYLLRRQQQQQESNESDPTKSKTHGNIKGCGRMGVIAANPAQSKHLETATMKVHGIEVDFSNLRHEAYADPQSRIPTITAIGTPLEDSYRRDFTINALYYNLHTQQIEDWTRRGLQNLLSEPRLIVTPLEAYQTFQDDPLRVLRAIRFSVRFDTQLHPALVQAAMDPNIHDELHKKVSRERVGKELEGCLSGKHSDPQKAFQRLCDLHLAGCVFLIPTSSQLAIQGTIGQGNLQQVVYNSSSSQDDDSIKIQLRKHAWEESKRCLDLLPLVLKTGNGSPAYVDNRLAYMATLLLPFMRLQYDEKSKTKYVVEFMMREGIKFKNKDCQDMVTIATHIDRMIALVQLNPPLEPSPSLRLQAGLLLRDTKDLWTTMLIVSTVSLIRSSGQPPGSIIDQQKKIYSVIVDDLQLHECWKVKPLMNGKQLMQELNLERGPQVGVYNQEQIRWLLVHPQGTKEDCIKHLQIYQMEGEHNAGTQHISKKMHL